MSNEKDSLEAEPPEIVHLTPFADGFICDAPKPSRQSAASAGKPIQYVRARVSPTVDEAADKNSGKVGTAQIAPLLEAIVDFDDWVWCECSECRADASSHAINTHASMAKLAESVRALISQHQSQGEK